jgi:hypothetical protein
MAMLVPWNSVRRQASLGGPHMASRGDTVAIAFATCGSGPTSRHRCDRIPDHRPLRPRKVRRGKRGRHLGEGEDRIAKRQLVGDDLALMRTRRGVTPLVDQRRSLVVADRRVVAVTLPPLLPAVAQREASSRAAAGAARSRTPPYRFLEPVRIIASARSRSRFSVHCSLFISSRAALVRIGNRGTENREL